MVVIRNEEVAIYEKAIHRLKQQRKELDNKRNEINAEIREYKDVIKKLLGTLGNSSSSSSSSNAVNGNQVPSAAASRKERADASHYEFVTQNESVELISTVGDLDSEPELRLSSTFIKTGQPPKKKTRCIEFLSTNADQFLISGDDGYIRKWQLESVMKASPIMDFDARCNGSFPEAFSVNPAEESIVAVYGPKEKLLVFSLCGPEELGERKRVTEIEERPHKRGISQVAFMPWANNGNPVFISSGNLSHDIASWGLFDSAWKTTGHHFFHTNLVTGLCGLYHRFVVISVGRDKLISSLDLERGAQFGKDNAEAECRGVAANPVDFNLLCVQTSTNQNQLRLWDVRKEGELFSFGWQKTGHVPKSALVAPAWSPDGLLLSAGSAEKEVKVFDIRFSDKMQPVTCEQPHRGRVFKVAWAPNHRVLLSTSVDRKIGLHRF